MPEVARPVAVEDLKQFSIINNTSYEFLPMQVFPSQDGEAGDAVRVVWSSARNRYEYVKTGGAGQAAGTANSVCDGFLMESRKYQGNHLDVSVTIVKSATVSNYTSRTVDEVVPLYLSPTVAGNLADTEPFAGAPQVGKRFGNSYNSDGRSNGEVVVLDVRGVK
jgi:hypothetical protein